MAALEIYLKEKYGAMMRISYAPLTKGSF